MQHRVLFGLLVGACAIPWVSSACGGGAGGAGGALGDGGGLDPVNGEAGVAPFEAAEAGTDGAVSCGDTQLDSHNCGKCGRGCQGGACVFGSCSAPGSRGADCAAASDCNDKKCSPVTKTCDGCFTDGKPCGNSSECCGSGLSSADQICNTKGTCGRLLKQVGEPCNTSDATCVSGSWCNPVGRCDNTDLCLSDAECASDERCESRQCTRKCNTIGSTAECVGAQAGGLCDPYRFVFHLNSGIPSACGCRDDKDCPAGRICANSGPQKSFTCFPGP